MTLIRNYDHDDKIKVELFPLMKIGNEEKTFTVEIRWEPEQKSVTVQVIRHEDDHEGEVFGGTFKRMFKDGESWEDIEVVLPCGCNSYNDILKVNFHTKEPAQDERVILSKKYNHSTIWEAIRKKYCQRIKCKKYEPYEFCLDCEQKIWEKLW